MLGMFLKNSAPKDNVHPDFPDLPLGLGLNSMVKFRISSSKMHLLMNDGKIQTRFPEQAAIVKAVSVMNPFGLNVYRGYLDSQYPESIIQINCDGNEIINVLLFNNKMEFVVENDANAQKEWRSMIGWKEIKLPNNTTYFRYWSMPVEEYGEMVTPLRFYEWYFLNKEMKQEITNEAMLYTRRIDGCGEDNTEYLLISFRTGLRRYRVEVWTGVVVSVRDIEII